MTNIEKFDSLYKKFFEKIDSSHKIIIGGAHLYDIKEQRRIHQYFHVNPELKKENFFDSLNESFFKIKDRAKFFEIVNLKSIKKRHLIWIRTNPDQIFTDLENLELDQMLIPQNLFTNNKDIITEVILKRKALKEYLLKKWNEIKEKDEWKSFYCYFCSKLSKIIGSDVSENYRPQFDIFVLLNSIMFYAWKFIHFFPTDPPGGFFVYLNDKLNDEEIECYFNKAQKITNEISLEQ